MKRNDALFYTCSLIEYIGRKSKNKRSDVIEALGKDVKRIYDYSDVFHCEMIEKVADEFIERNHIKDGTFDNIAKCKYEIPDYWDIGEVFERVIEDNYTEENVIKGIQDVFSSVLAGKILNFNSDLYYQSRDYLSECYKEGKVLTA